MQSMKIYVFKIRQPGQLESLLECYSEILLMGLSGLLKYILVVKITLMLQDKARLESKFYGV